MSQRLTQTSAFSQTQTPSKLNGLSRCYDFNYQNRNQKNYYGDSDRFTSSMAYKKQNLTSQDRRQTNYYASPKDNQSQLTYKRDNGSFYVSRSSQLYEDNNNNLSNNSSFHVGRIQTDLFKYSTPQKSQTMYYNREHASSLSEQWEKQNEGKNEKFYEGNGKEYLKERTVSYSAKHSIYPTSSNKKSQKEEGLNLKDEYKVLDYQKISHKKQIKLMDSPTKENDYINLQTNINHKKYNNLQSYNGFISRSPTNYLQRQSALESPMKNENRILCENYSKTLNLKLSSACTRVSSPQNNDTKISNKSLRATQSDKKDFSDDIEFYKNELQQYQIQLNNYQEQLRNTLNKNKIECFEVLNSYKDDIESKNSNSLQFNHLNFQSKNQDDSCSVETESKLDKSEFNSKYVNHKTRLINKSSPFYQTQEITSFSPEIDLFQSIKIEDTIFEYLPEKVLDVINLDLSNSSHFTKGESEHFQENNSTKNIPVLAKRQIIEQENISTHQPESTNDKIEKNEIGNKNCTKNLENYQNVFYGNKDESREEKQDLNRLRDDYSILYKKRLVFDQFEFEDKQRSSSSHIYRQNIQSEPHALGQKSNILENNQKISILNKNNKHNFQLSDNFNSQIDSVNKSQVGQKINKQTIPSNSLIKNIEESSTTGINQPLSTSIDLQKRSSQTSENIINNQQDKLNYIEQRYKRVEEITKKYSHLYKSKLLQQSSDSKNQSSNKALQLTENKQDIQSQTTINTNLQNNIKQMNNTPLYTTKRNSMLDSSMIPAVDNQRVINSTVLLVPQQNYFKNSEDDINVLITETPRFQVDNDIEYFSSAQQILQMNQQQNMINQDFCSIERIEETLQNLSLNTMEEEENTHTFRQQQQFPSISCL